MPLIHECNSPTCSQEADTCWCDRCFEDKLEEAYEDGKKDGIAEAQENVN